jgi:hypothetical protein
LSCNFSRSLSICSALGHKGSWLSSVVFIVSSNPLLRVDFSSRGRLEQQHRIPEYEKDSPFWFNASLRLSNKPSTLSRNGFPLVTCDKAFHEKAGRSQVQQDSQLSCRSDDGAFLAALSSAFGQLRAPAPQVAVDPVSSVSSTTSSFVPRR